MKQDKSDYLKQKNGPENGKFRIVRHSQLPIDPRPLYSLIWSTSGRTVYFGEWEYCIKVMHDCIRSYKNSNGKPYPWQFIGPVTYYNAMDQYLARQKQITTTEQEK